MKVGFEVEGRLKEVVYRNGRYFDLVWMGLTKKG
ncbi:GNAT family protein [Acetomicrobium sp. S15 = DSM 107314]|nr:GNAT family protein [Acetomicrobium sp. S15 = DSM 107314]